MSTKSTIKHGEIEKTHFHLYEESFERDCVYLELEGEVSFEVEPGRCTVKIPLAIWETIRHGTHSILRSMCADKTDAELLAMAQEHVRTRIEDHKSGSKFAALFGTFTFGSIDDPEDVQVSHGLEEYKQVRDLVAKVKAESKTLEK